MSEDNEHKTTESDKPRKKLGRKKINVEAVVTVKTRVPEYVRIFLMQLFPVNANYLWLIPDAVKQSVPHRQNSASSMLELALSAFMHFEPWNESGFEWRSPKVAVAVAKSAKDWVQYPIVLRTSVAHRIFVPNSDPELRKSRVPEAGLCKTLDVTLATFLWTGIRWFLLNIERGRHHIPDQQPRLLAES